MSGVVAIGSRELVDEWSDEVDASSGSGFRGVSERGGVE